MLPFSYCYYRVRCLDMWGGDIQSISQLSSQAEAIIIAKNRINYNGNYCATISKGDNGLYSVWVKNKIKTNPSNNQDHWNRCQTIFYGKKITRWKGSSNEYLDCMTQHNPDKTMIKFEYFVSEGLYMSGVSLEKHRANSDVEAEKILKEIVAYNDSLCGLITKKWGSPEYVVELKDMRKCNPSEMKQGHYCRTTVFVGEQI